MGLFNTLTAEVRCSRCGATENADVQFKFGDLWNYRYRTGDTLRLRDDQGWALHKRVAAQGIARACRSCGNRFVEIDVVIENGVIIGTRPHDPARHFPPDESYFVEG